MVGGRKAKYLNTAQLDIFQQAVAVSEEVVGDWFQLSLSEWKRYRYEIRTGRDLDGTELVPEVFAQIVRYGRPAPPAGLRSQDFYRICLQDQNILAALRREPLLRLMPLLVYVVTHELVHVIRFYKFHQFFEADDEQRRAEEIRVHSLTFNILKDLKIADLPLVFDFYCKHRLTVD